MQILGPWGLNIYTVGPPLTLVAPTSVSIGQERYIAFNEQRTLWRQLAVTDERWCSVVAELDLTGCGGSSKNLRKPGPSARRSLIACQPPLPPRDPPLTRACGGRSWALVCFAFFWAVVDRSLVGVGRGLWFVSHFFGRATVVEVPSTTRAWLFLRATSTWRRRATTAPTFGIADVQLVLAWSGSMQLMARAWASGSWARRSLA